MAARKLSAEQKIARIARIFDTCKQQVVDGHKITTSTHAYYNLEGAILSIQHDKGHCSKASMNTLGRVSTQLAQIGQIIRDDLP